MLPIYVGYSISMEEFLRKFRIFLRQALCTIQSPGLWIDQSGAPKNRELPLCLGIRLQMSYCSRCAMFWSSPRPLRFVYDPVGRAPRHLGAAISAMISAEKNGVRRMDLCHESANGMELSKNMSSKCTMYTTYTMYLFFSETTCFECKEKRPVTSNVPALP